jgi:hypothetical protein
MTSLVVWWMVSHFLVLGRVVYLPHKLLTSKEDI